MLRFVHFSLECARAPARRLLLGSVALVATAAAATAFAQFPTARLHGIFPPGGQQGTSVGATISGVDLENAGQLVFSHPGIAAQQKTTEPNAFQDGPQPVANQFTLTIAADVPVGVYEVRALGKYGLSNPRFFAVDALPEVAEAEPNNDPKKPAELALNGIVNGRADGGTDLDYYQFAAQAGQRIVVRLLAEQIDSQMDGTLVLYDANGRELQRSRDAVGRDPLLDFTAPAAGDYVVKVYDFVYGGGADYFYRLSAGTAPHVDYIFPPAGLPGTTGEFTLFGRNLPGSVPADGATIEGRPLEKLAVQIAIPADPAQQRPAQGALIAPAAAGLDAIDYRLTTPQGTSNTVLVGVASAAIVTEIEPNDDGATAQKISLPCEFAGQFQVAGDVDRIAFDATEGAVYWIEVVSQRRGLRTDPLVVVERVTVDAQGVESVAEVLELDDAGANLGGFAFNTATEDGAVQFTAPATASYRLAVRNQFRYSGPEYVYRLAIRQAAPDFRLVAVPQHPLLNTQNTAGLWTPVLRRGGTEVLRVLAFRRDGFNGEIQVAVEGLPQGVTAQPAAIGPDQTAVGLVLVAAEDAPPWSGEIRVVGRAQMLPPDPAATPTEEAAEAADAAPVPALVEVAREARAGVGVWDAALQTSARARVAAKLMLAVLADDLAPFLVDAGGAQIWDVTRGGTLSIPVKITRRGEIKAAVNLLPILPPPNVAIPAVAINPDQTEVVLQAPIPGNAPEGTFTFYLEGATTVGYRRNPEAAAAAAAYQAKLEPMVPLYAEEVNKAAAAKVEADNAAAAATTNVANTEQAKNAAVQAAQQAAAELKAAEDALAAAKAALDADAANQALIDAHVAAQGVVAVATEKAKTTAEAQAAAEKAYEEAIVAMKSAEEARLAADKVNADALAKQQALLAELAVATQASQAAATAANPVDVAVFVPSTPITIRISSGPMKLAARVPSAVKQGGQIEIPVTIERLSGFAEQVELELVPGQRRGRNRGNRPIPLTADKVVIPAGQTQAVLVVKVAADARIRSYTMVVRGVGTFNGQNVEGAVEVQIAVEAAQ